MVGELFLLILVVLLLIFYGEILPVGFYNTPAGERKNFSQKKHTTFVMHVHSFFSYDSLGKPEEIYSCAKKLNIDRVFITDHNEKPYLQSRFQNLVFGVEKDSEIYGRILEIKNLKVLAHTNNPKKYKRDFSFLKKSLKEPIAYELINLKDALGEIPVLGKAYIIFKSLLLFPLYKHKAVKIFVRFIPVEKWLLRYLKLTEGKLPIIGGADHHVKISFWEKRNKAFSFPSYCWSFYLVQNKLLNLEKNNENTLTEEILQAILNFSTYISFGEGQIYIEKDFLIPERKKTLIKAFDRKANLCLIGEGGIKLEKKFKAILVYSYLFKIKNFYFGLKPYAVYLLKHNL